MVKEGKKITGPEQLKEAAYGCARIRGDTLGIVGLGKRAILGIRGRGHNLGVTEERHVTCANFFLTLFLSLRKFLKADLFHLPNIMAYSTLLRLTDCLQPEVGARPVMSIGLDVALSRTSSMTLG